MSLQVTTVPSATEMAIFQTMAKQAATSKFYNGIGGEGGVMMIMLAARELGIPPVQALNGGIHIIQGKVEISARMLHGMMRRAGIKITIMKNTDDECVLQGIRNDGSSATVSYSVEDAKKAQLIKAGGGWTKCPKDMCFARCISRLGRVLAPDIIGIGYVEGEIKDNGDVPDSMETIVAEVSEPEVRPTEIQLQDSPKLKNLRGEAVEQFNSLSGDQKSRFEKGLIRNQYTDKQIDEEKNPIEKVLQGLDEEKLHFILDGIESIKGAK